MKVKSTKSPILRPIILLQYYKFINGLPQLVDKEKMPKVYSVNHIYGKLWVKSIKLSILRSIFHMKHCKSINVLTKLLWKQNNTKYIVWKAQIGHRSSESCKKSQHLGKMKVKDTKLSILGPIFYLEYCKSINGPKKWLCK